MSRSHDWRARAVRRMPVWFIEYPFEAWLGAALAVSGSAQALGVTSSASVAALLPEPLARAWGAALALGGIVVVIGLARHRYGTVVSSGLTLEAATMSAYIVTVLAAHGWHVAGTAAMFVLALAATAAGRAFVLRSRYVLLCRVVEVSERPET